MSEREAVRGPWMDGWMVGQSDVTTRLQIEQKCDVKRNIDSDSESLTGEKIC